VWTSQEGNEAGAVGSNGKGIGMDTDIYFTASGELDNGWTVSLFSAMDMEQSNTATSGGLNSSAQLTIGLGSLGTFQLNDISGSAANAIDDVLPFAYEEPWDGTTHSSDFHTFGVATTSGSIDYRTPAISLGDITVSASYTYDPNQGSGSVSAGAASTVAQEGEAWTAKISGMGLTIGAGYEETEQAETAAGATAAKYNTGYIKYSSGPITIGYQEFYTNPSNTAASGAQAPDIEGDGMAVAFSQDSYSVSYSEINEKVKNIAAVTSMETEMSAIQATYTMGAMTLGMSIYETDNPEGTTGKYEETELSVSFAF